jgi:hypothetical protein
MVMIVIMVAIRTMHMALGLAVFRFDRGFQLRLGHGAIGDLGLLEQEVDDLVLIERRAQLGGGHRLVLDILHEALAVLRAILLRGLHDRRCISWALRNLDTVGLADFGQQQAEADAAHGDTRDTRPCPSISAQGGFLVFLMSRFMLKLGPDLAEFGFDHRRRNVEVMTLRPADPAISASYRCGSGR